MDEDGLQEVAFDPSVTDVSGDPVGGAGVSTDASGESVVTVTASREAPTVWPWVIGIATLLYLVSRRHRG